MHHKRARELTTVFPALIIVKSAGTTSTSAQLLYSPAFFLRQNPLFPPPACS